MKTALDTIRNLIRNRMTIDEIKADLKRKKLLKISVEVMGAMDFPIKEFDTLETFVNRLSEAQLREFYDEVCDAVFRAAYLDIEDQYDLNRED